MRPRRIAYVLNIFPKISETFIMGELAELRRRGVELRVLSLLPPRDEPQHAIVREAGLDRVVEYEVQKFADVVRQFQPDLLHSHFAKEATGKARELSVATGVPFTFTAHGYDIYRKPPSDFAARAAAARAVVTVSIANREYIAQTFGVPLEHISVIPCGVDTERFCPRDNTEFKPLPPLILCVARLVKVKNLGLLLEAIAGLKRRGKALRCVVIGEGPERAELETVRQRLGLEDVVELPGAASQAEVLNWWQRARIGVLTSQSEGMPVSLMEAAACGVPVVATRVGGIPELVADGVTGLLVPPDDAEGLVGAFAQLLDSNTLWERMSSAARQQAIERHSVSHQVDALLQLWEQVLSQAGDAKAAAASRRTVSDPFGAIADKDLPTLPLALDFAQVRPAFKHAFPTLSAAGFVRPKSIRVVRHKPGRRAVVEYDVHIRENGIITGRLTLIGKVRARRYGNEGFRLQQALWDAGLNTDSGDNIAVPEPLGIIPEFRMWFQRKVSGRTAEVVFSRATTAEGVALARRVAEAIVKVHRSGVPTEKAHAMADELRILRTCFEKVKALRPDWAVRLDRLFVACENAGAALPAPAACGIHRDFYQSQVIVDGERLWLLDFDLYCLGDPGLDVGNFIGHLTEQALRERGSAAAFEPVEQALEDRFVGLEGEPVRAAVRVYTTLTLARHIFLSTQIPGRESFTETLLVLCERRLGIA